MSSSSTSTGGLLACAAPTKSSYELETAFAGPADDDDVLDRADVAEHGLDLREVVAVDEQDPCLGVVQDPGPLLRVEPVVQERERHAGGGHAVVGLDVLRDVLREDADPVALARDAEQGVREPKHALVEGAEADLAVVDDERRATGRLLRVQPDDVSEKHSAPPCTLPAAS